MSVLTVQVPDDLAPNQNKEREYDVYFVVSDKPRPGTRVRPGKQATFHFWRVEDIHGFGVHGPEYELVVKHAEDCYYEELLAEARGR